MKHIWLAAAVSYYPVFKMPFRPTEPTKKEKKVFCVLPGEDVHAHVDAHVDAHDDEDDDILYIVYIAFSKVL